MSTTPTLDMLPQTEQEAISVPINQSSPTTSNFADNNNNTSTTTTVATTTSNNNVSGTISSTNSITSSNMVVTVPSSNSPLASSSPLATASTFSTQPTAALATSISANVQHESPTKTTHDRHGHSTNNNNEPKHAPVSPPFSSAHLPFQGANAYQQQQQQHHISQSVTQQQQHTDYASHSHTGNNVSRTKTLGQDLFLRVVPPPPIYATPLPPPSSLASGVMSNEEMNRPFMPFFQPSGVLPPLQTTLPTEQQLRPSLPPLQVHNLPGLHQHGHQAISQPQAHYHHHQTQHPLQTQPQAQQSQSPYYSPLSSGDQADQEVQDEDMMDDENAEEMLDDQLSPNSPASSASGAIASDGQNEKRRRKWPKGDPACVVCHRKGSDGVSFQRNYTTGSILEIYRVCFGDSAIEDGILCASCYAKCYAFRKKNNMNIKKLQGKKIKDGILTPDGEAGTPTSAGTEPPAKPVEEKTVNIFTCVCCSKQGKHTYKYSSYASDYQILYPDVTNVPEDSMVCHGCYRKCFKIRQARLEGVEPTTPITPSTPAIVSSNTFGGTISTPSPVTPIVPNASTDSIPKTTTANSGDEVTIETAANESDQSNNNEPIDLDKCVLCKMKLHPQFNYLYASNADEYRAMCPEVKNEGNVGHACPSCYRKLRNFRKKNGIKPEGNRKRKSSGDLNNSISDEEPYAKRTRKSQRKQSPTTATATSTTTAEPVLVYFEVRNIDASDVPLEHATSFRQHVPPHSKHSELLRIAEDILAKYNEQQQQQLSLSRLVMVEADKWGRELEVGFLEDDCFDDYPIETKTRFGIYVVGKK